MNKFKKFVLSFVTSIFPALTIDSAYASFEEDNKKNIQKPQNQNFAIYLNSYYGEALQVHSLNFHNGRVSYQKTEGLLPYMEQFILSVNLPINARKEQVNEIILKNSSSDEDTLVIQFKSQNNHVIPSCYTEGSLEARQVTQEEGKYIIEAVKIE